MFKPSFTDLIRHLDAAKAEARAFALVGCYELAAIRSRDADWLRAQIEALRIFDAATPMFREAR